jgi:FMN phosphatase YigB (HAD superfamily)
VERENRAKPVEWSACPTRRRTLDSVSIAVFDIDGVVADVRHRVHYVERRGKDWGRFFDAAVDDTPSRTGVDWALLAAAEHELVWLTGRPEWLRDVTRRWLTQHGLPVNRLIMRANHDYRPARDFKVAELGNLAQQDDIVVFVDDDPQVIDAAAAAGFTASLATWLPRGKGLADAQERSGRT